MVRGFHYKQSIVIETRSALPVHYTLTEEGKGKFGNLSNLVKNNSVTLSTKLH